MAQNYDITFEATPVGTARMEKQGLYYQFSCRCRLPDEGLYRIHAICENKREDLGICVPMDDGFGMDKKLPIKRLGEGITTFELIPKDWKPEMAMKQDYLPEVNTQDDEIALDAKMVSPVSGEISEDVQEEHFIPVSDRQPFEYLDKLENAVFAIKDEQIGIIISDME